MDQLFKALGDENRLRIINLLRQGELCVCELEAILDSTQSTISRHLTRLKNDQIVMFEKRAQWIYYQIHPDFLKNHRLLYQYLLEQFDQDSRFQMDLETLQQYHTSDFTCDNISQLRKINQ